MRIRRTLDAAAGGNKMKMTSSGPSLYRRIRNNGGQLTGSGQAGPPADAGTLYGYTDKKCQYKRTTARNLTG